MERHLPTVLLFFLPFRVAALLNRPALENIIDGISLIIVLLGIQLSLETVFELFTTTTLLVSAPLFARASSEGVLGIVVEILYHTPILLAWMVVVVLVKFIDSYLYTTSWPRILLDFLGISCRQ
ncbi:hypothetical protein F4777DRAFT_596934 [Nemania sp. FL0916]|nr:hypothetical protein F4777DRAFT_596934 [Nemania sp. FL0916]